MSVVAMLSVWQPHDNGVLTGILRECRILTYNAIEYAENNGLKSRKQMNGFYRSINSVNLPSCFKLAIITRACSVLRSRRKSENKSVQVKYRKPLKLMACITAGFFITSKGKLFISLGHDKFEMVQLNCYAFAKVSAPNIKMRSLTITEDRIGICYSKQVEAIHCHRVFGVDRNEKNLTFGNRDAFETIDLSQIARVNQTTREILSSFKRNDDRVKRRLFDKYWGRASRRTNQVLHDATNRIVEKARSEGAALALEDIAGINKMYQKGNGQGKDYRFRMNSWAHGKTCRMIDYKSADKGVTVVKLTKTETRGSSSTHFGCGEKLQSPAKRDLVHRRHLWCNKCERWVHRDVNAVFNLADRGLSRLASSLPPSEKMEVKGHAGEAMNGNPTTMAVIPGADAMQVDSGCEPKS